MTLTSAPVPPLGDDDHVIGPDGAPVVVLYAEFTCPHCALAYVRVRDRGEHRVVFRHFAVRARSARAPALGAAAEAAARQGAFWAFADALVADPGRTDDPHLWARAEALGLDVARFDADRRGDDCLARVARDTREGMRAGVVATPAFYPPVEF